LDFLDNGSPVSTFGDVERLREGMVSGEVISYINLRRKWELSVNPLILFEGSR
jgi:hypothetical protein